MHKQTREPLNERTAERRNEQTIEKNKRTNEHVNKTNEDGRKKQQTNQRWQSLVRDPVTRQVLKTTLRTLRHVTQDLRTDVLFGLPVSRSASAPARDLRQMCGYCPTDVAPLGGGAFRDCVRRANISAQATVMASLFRRLTLKCYLAASY